MFTLGRTSSGSFLELQNIFVAVLSSACISKPIVGVYFIGNSINNKIKKEKGFNIKEKGNI